MRFSRFFLLIFGLSLLIASAVVAVGHQQSTEGLWVITFDRVVDDDWYRVEIFPNDHVRERPIHINDEISLFSPDNRWRLYTETDYRPKQLFVERSDGRESYVVDENFVALYGFRWSPDSQWIIFYDNAESYRTHTYHISVNDGILSENVWEESLFLREWSPDGEWLLGHWYQTDNTESLIQLRPGGNVWDAVLWKHEDIINIYESQYACKGECVVFAADGSINERELFQVRVDGSGLEKIEISGSNSSLSVSPDGNWLAFVNYPIDSGDLHLYKVNLNSGQMIQLATDITIRYPSGFYWTSDNENIAFFGSGQAESYLYQVDTNTGQTIIRYSYRNQGNTGLEYHPLPTFSWSTGLWMAVGSLMAGVSILVPVWWRGKCDYPCILR